MRRLSELARPFVVAVVTERSLDAARGTVARAAAAGADAYELNLPLLRDAELERVSELLAGSPGPVYTSCRRSSFMPVYGRGEVPTWSEDERMRRQLELLDRGSVAIDVELDAFDAVQPLGVSDSPAAVARQRETVAAAHDAGGEVIASCHTQTAVPRASVLRVAEVAQERGADLAKVVVPVGDASQALELLAAAVAIRERALPPTTVIAAGAPGRFTRLVSPHLGRSWALCQERVEEGGFPEQPLVADARTALTILAALDAA